MDEMETSARGADGLLRRGWLRLLDGKRPWGAIDVLPDRFGVTRYRLMVYRPDITESERRWVRVAHASPAEIKWAIRYFAGPETDEWYCSLFSPAGRRIFLAVFGAGLFQALYGSYEYLTGHQHIFGYAKRFYTDSATGTYINQNHYAGALELAVRYALRRRNRLCFIFSCGHHSSPVL